MKYKDREHYDGTKDWKNYYWYYYKWHILGGLFLALVIIICTAQCAMKVDPDSYIVFYSDVYVMDQVLDEITDELGLYGEDINGDGKVHIQPINCTYSPTQPQTQGASNQRAMMQLHSTDAPIWIMDEAGIETFVNDPEMDLFLKEDGNLVEIKASSLKASKTLSYLVEDSGKEYYVFVRKTTDHKSLEFALDMLKTLAEKSK